MEKKVIKMKFIADAKISATGSGDAQRIVLTLEEAEFNVIETALMEAKARKLLKGSDNVVISQLLKKFKNFE